MSSRSGEGYLGLGSNLGDPLERLRSALVALGDRGIAVNRLSSVYRTEPVEAPSSPWFLNAIAFVRFEGDHRDLLRICQDVEAAGGRSRKRSGAKRNAPRTIDLDVLLVGDEVVASPDLTIPHPRLAQRRFVLVPMVEIAPDVVHPVSGLTMRQLLGQCPDASLVEVVSGAAALAPCA